MFRTESKTLLEKDSLSSRTTKSSFFSRTANFGKVSPFLIGATNTLSELIHPLIKLPNCVWNSTIYPKRSALLAHSLFEERAQALLAQCHFQSFLILHYIYYISQRSNAKNCFRITGYSVKESLKTPSSRPILIYFEFTSKPLLITVIWMDPHSPKKFIATKYCFFILGDDTSIFLSFVVCFFIFRFYVMLCYLFCYYKFLQKLFSIYCSFYYLLLSLLLLFLLFI